jgi:hypothetical protein
MSLASSADRSPATSTPALAAEVKRLSWMMSAASTSPRVGHVELATPTRLASVARFAGPDNCVAASKIPA